MKKFFKEKEKLFLSIIVVSFGIILFLILSLKGIFAKKENASLNLSDKEVEEIYSLDVPEDLIYASSFILPDTNIDLSDLDAIYEYADLVIVGTVTEKKDGVMLEGFNYASLPGTIEVEKVIKGNYSDIELNFFVKGGYCTILEYINALVDTQPEKINRLGFNELSLEDKESKYLLFNYQFGKDFEINKRYVIMLEKLNDRFLVISKYGFLEIEENTNIEELSDIINMVDN